MVRPSVNVHQSHERPVIEGKKKSENDVVHLVKCRPIVIAKDKRLETAHQTRSAFPLCLVISHRDQLEGVRKIRFEERFQDFVGKNDHAERSEREISGRMVTRGGCRVGTGSSARGLRRRVVNGDKVVRAG